ncbi:MAG: hypothetical protein ACOY5Y_18340 [Pseudomonadota bacterium]|jgi:hypothetical protein
MGRGSYRGGSTPVGWNANRYVAPSLTGRTRKGKALIKDLTARTAQSRSELAEQDRLARKRHGLAPRKPKAAEPPGASASDVGGMTRKRRKGEAPKPFAVTVVRRRRSKRQGVSGSGPT